MAQMKTSPNSCDRNELEKKQPKERRRADNAIAAERAFVNAALTDEQGESPRSSAGLIEKAREETDRSMMEERHRADATSVRSSKRIADEIRAHEKTKMALTTRDEFLAIVSHDLRNPIGAVSTCASMLLEDFLYHDMNPEIRHWITFVKRNADTALNMIRDLLDMERLAEGKLQLNIGRHDLNVVVREAVENFILIAAAKNILLRAIENPRPVYARCDRERVLQVLSNLIGNALTYTPGNGSVVVRTAVNDDEIKISVTDTGPGIPAEKQAQIFERFAQLGTKNRQGLGLGLYISKMLIVLHEGRIWVESEPGKGSSFYFTVPAASDHDGSLQ